MVLKYLNLSNNQTKMCKISTYQIIKHFYEELMIYMNGEIYHVHGWEQ